MPKVRRHSYARLRLGTYRPSRDVIEEINLPLDMTHREVARAAQAVIARAEELGDKWKIGLMARPRGRWSIVLVPYSLNLDDAAAPRTLH